MSQLTQQMKDAIVVTWNTNKVQAAKNPDHILAAFKTEVMLLAGLNGLGVEFKEGNYKDLLGISLSDGNGKFSVFIGKTMIYELPLEEALNIVKRNLNRKDRGQW